MQNLQNEVTRKLAAIMFVDIAGYSKMMGKDVEKTLDLIESVCFVLSQVIDNAGT